MIVTRLCSLLLIFIFLSCNTFSQEGASSIQQKFEVYNHNNYQEKIFLHTDKTVYATGEVLWFKAYITDAASNNFSLLSKICYVEILSKENKPVLQAKISIDSGRGNGSFLLPSSIRSGNFILRAYTNWMKNFDPQFYFQQTVSIINPNKKPEYNKSDIVAHNNIDFFPEGGNLVYGLKSTIAFKFSDSYNNGLDGKGFIINETNDTVAKFETEKFGMGTFSFTPLKQNKYHAIVKLKNETIKKELPKIYNTGWVLHIKDEGKTLSVNVACNNEEERYVFVFVNKKNITATAQMQNFNNGVATFTIDKAALADGVSQITVFNEEKQPVCERLYFKKPQSNLQIKLDSVKPQYGLRNKVDVSISASVNNADTANADLSVAVYLTDSLQPEQKINIINYIYLASEMKGSVESPQYYFESPMPDAEKAADNLMLTQGWRRFNWDDILKNKKSFFSFLPEVEGHIITGKLIPKKESLKDSAVNVFISVPGKNFKFSNTVSDADGVMKFNIDKFYGNREIIVQTNNADSNYNLVIDNPYSTQYIDSTIAPLKLQPEFAGNILLRSIGAQSANIYQPEKENNFKLPQPYDTSAFFGKPSKQYYLDAYTRFPTMEEVIREYVKEVHLKKKVEDFHFEVLNEPDLTYFNDDPLVLIDGVPVYNFNKIINIDPMKIEKIDVITTKFFQGHRQYDGIVSYATYNGDLNGYELNTSALVVEYDGLQYEREFYSPQYETESELKNRLPDYRNVLYWSPQVNTKNGKQNFSFYTSDIPGKYVMVSEGISDSGIPCFSSKTFNVVR